MSYFFLILNKIYKKFMMKKFTFILTVLMFALNINAQNELWPNEPVNTGSNATYLVNSVTFNGNDLVFGKIGAFFINDLGNYQCGGWQTWTGSNTQIAAMGDDATTEEKDGFEPGEEIIWLGTNDNGVTTYEASVTYVEFMGQIGNSNFTANTVNIISPFAISNIQYCNNDADGDGICDENESTGCTDPDALNYNADAEVDDGSCIAVVLGCTDESADNYNEAANTDDGTCSIAGCMNNEAQNYNEAATIDDGSCIVTGCTDQNAFNYNANATEDDESCLNAINIDYDTVPTNNSINYIIVDDSLTVNLGDSEIITNGDILGVFQIVNGELYCVGYNPWEEDLDIALWLDDTSTPEVDGYVSNEPTYWIVNQNSTGVNYLLDVTINEFDIITNITVNTNFTLGCTDSDAVNYNSATGVIEDGSCIDIVLGCTDQNACGFDSSANTDDGSCYELTVEINISAENTLSVNVESTNADDVLTNPSYTWYLDGIETGGVINGVIIQSGDYSLSVTDDLGCEQSSSTIQANLSTNDFIENNILVYPNPANKVINITSNNTDIYSLDLFNVIGELVLSKSDVNSKVIIINKNELNSGIYISKITDINGNSIVRNIIFE